MSETHIIYLLFVLSCVFTLDNAYTHFLKIKRNVLVLLALIWSQIYEICMQIVFMYFFIFFIHMNFQLIHSQTSKTLINFITPTQIDRFKRVFGQTFNFSIRLHAFRRTSYVNQFAYDEILLFFPLSAWYLNYFHGYDEFSLTYLSDSLNSICNLYV